MRGPISPSSKLNSSGKFARYWICSRNSSRDMPSGASQSMSCRAIVWSPCRRKALRSGPPTKRSPPSSTRPTTIGRPSWSSHRRGVLVGGTTEVFFGVRGMDGSPDGDFLFQRDVEALLYAGAHQVDEAKHVPAAGAGMDDDVIGIAVADLGAADARPSQIGFLDQRR